MTGQTALAAVLALLCALGAQAQTALGPISPPGVLATIGDFNVTEKYLSSVVENQFAREVMDSIVRMRVVEDEAAARGIKVRQEDVNAALAKEKEAYASDEEFLEAVQQMGLTPKGYRERVRMRLLLEALMGQAAGPVTDEQARAYFEAHKAEFEPEAELHVLALAAASQDDALVAYRSVMQGTPFKVAAKRFSAGPPPGQDGDLGWLRRSTAPVKGLWDLAAGLKAGDTSPPTELDGKFWVVHVNAWRSAADFETVKEQIKAKLRPRPGVGEEEYVNGLIARANVRIIWPPVYYLNDEYALLRGIRVFVDGMPVRAKPAPYIAPGGVMMVPAKPVLQAVGAKLTWRPGTKSMEIKRGETTVSVTLDDKAALVNGAERQMKAAPVLKDGFLFIPPRDVLSALGVKVGYNPKTKVLLLSTAPTAGGTGYGVSGRDF